MNHPSTKYYLPPDEGTPSGLRDEWNLFAGDIPPPDDFPVNILFSFGTSSTTLDLLIAIFGHTLDMQTLFKLTDSQIQSGIGWEAAEELRLALGTFAAEYAFEHWDDSCTTLSIDRATRAKHDPVFRFSAISQRAWTPSCLPQREVKSASKPNLITIGSYCHALEHCPRLLPFQIRFDLDAYLQLCEQLDDFGVLPDQIRELGAMSWRESWGERFPEDHGTSISGNEWDWLGGERLSQPTRAWNLLCRRFQIFRGGNVTPAEQSNSEYLLNSNFPAEISRHEVYFLTLSEVGELCGLSRERVRQIEADSLRRLRCMDLPRLLVSTASKLIAQSGGVIAYRELSAQMDKLFDFTSANLAPAGILALCQTAFDFAKPLDAQVLGVDNRLNREIYRTITREARRLMEEGFWTGDENEVDQRLVSKIAEKSALPPSLHDAGLLRACLYASGDLVAQSLSVPVKNLPLRTLVMRVLLKAMHPMHFTHIAEHINRLGLRRNDASVGSIHTLLVYGRELFVCTAPGTYALKEWGLADQRETDRGAAFDLIPDIAEKLLCMHGKPVTRAEIIRYVLSHKRCRTYSIEQALYRDDRFTKVGSRWGLTKWTISSRSQMSLSLNDDTSETDNYKDDLLDLLFRDFGGGQKR